MTIPPPTPASGEIDLTNDERWALVLKIAAGPHLGKAHQLRDLLLFLAKRAIVAPLEDLTEQEIGSRVLGRRPDYNPQEDNIVRVQIRRLRQKLDEYFISEGLDESVVVSIPKGGHVLRFDVRPTPVLESPITTQTKPKGWWLVLAVALMGLTTAAFLVGRRSRSGSEVSAVPPAIATKSPLLPQLFVKGEPTTIVIADSSLVILQNILHQNFTLSEYIDRSYREKLDHLANSQLKEALQTIATRQYTSLADATLSSELRTIGTQLGGHVVVRYARHMNVRDFNSGNFVLIGSRHSVPWAELFDPTLNFRFEHVVDKNQFGFRNLKPAKGEQPIYVAEPASSGPQQSYAVISLIPNLTRSGAVLMLNGISMEATEAAGEFAMSEEFSRALAKISGLSPQNISYFEMLLKTTSMAGAPHQTTVVAWRKLGV